IDRQGQVLHLQNAGTRPFHGDGYGVAESPNSRRSFSNESALSRINLSQKKIVSCTKADARVQLKTCDRFFVVRIEQEHITVIANHRRRSIRLSDSGRAEDGACVANKLGILICPLQPMPYPRFVVARKVTEF